MQGCEEETSRRCLEACKGGDDFAKLAAEFSEDPGPKIREGSILSLKEKWFRNLKRRHFQWNRVKSATL